MNCPEHCVMNNRFFSLWMYGTGDIKRRYVPWKWWANPLRYQLVIYRKHSRRAIIVNRDGKARIVVSNLIFRCKKKLKMA